MTDDVLAQFADYGLQVDLPLVFGKLTRVRAEGDKGRDKTGWYIAYDERTDAGETIIFGSFGNWRMGETQKIKPKGVKLSDEDRQLMKARMEQAKAKKVETQERAAGRAAKRAARMWERLPTKGESAYLQRKQIIGLGVRYAPKSGAMLVPMRNGRGNIVGLQVIYPTVQESLGRDKTYWPYGLAKEGAFHMVGPHPEPGEAILVAEGYATGVSLHMATGLAVAICFDAGNLLPVGTVLREQFPGRQLIFCADDDWKTKLPNDEPYNTGVEKASKAATILGGMVVKPVWLGDRGDKETDFNDLHLNGGLEEVRRQVMAVVRPPAAGGWKDSLQRADSGALHVHSYNVQLILTNDERWAKVIAFNEFSSKIVKRRTPPYGGSAGEWSDLDDSMVVMWLAEQYNLRVTSRVVVEAVAVAAAHNAWHPVREYLDALEWDKQGRLDFWLHQCLGVDMSAYSVKVAARWMISAVARVMHPGCKADSVLILEGGQGEGKSTALSVLGGPWFMDSPFSLGDKDAYQAIRGKWIIELGELDSFNKAESTKAKQFFSAYVDTYRESYGRRTVDVQRQCVFAGTTNQEEYLKDTTGNRRYWPVLCKYVDIELLRSMRDQLWAEALHRYRAGERWWVERDETADFAEEQDARYMVDVWEHPIREWLEQPDRNEIITGDQVFANALKLDLGHWGKPEQMRVGHILQRLGWKRKRLPAASRSGVRPWGYVKPARWAAAGEIADAAEQARKEEDPF
ncbi:MAG: conjugal transfer protein TraC [Gammaproteobacteria bacterium HGW-Gammaproteobacteria-11]|nr:MAG: conjugal transfer protein TraC [Gammaproteobacteria bacterium HGW-Gammaproteobacteria-11]